MVSVNAGYERFIVRSYGPLLSKEFVYNIVYAAVYCHNNKRKNKDIRLFSLYLKI